MKTIGVLGGMGPAAGADFLQRLVATHAAPRDQDHPPCILYSATQVPDRTAHLLGDGADPTPDLRAAARVLESAGVDFIVIPCNSAHAFLDAIREAVGVVVVDMIGLAVAAAEALVPDARSIGVLAASGTVRIGLYDAPIEASGRTVLYPAESIQEDVMAAIKMIKGTGSGATDAAAAGGPRARLVAAAEHLQREGADCLILGCTEIPLALAADACPIPAVDANQVLVATALDLAGGKLEPEALAPAGSA